MQAWIYAGLRAGIQMVWSSIIALPALAGVRALLPEELPETVLIALIGAVTGVVGGLVVAGVRWLETRTGNDLGARAARRIAWLIMLAVSKYQPVYAEAKPGDSARSVDFVGPAPFAPRAKVVERRPALPE